MRNTVFGVFIALLGGNLLFMVSCEDKQSQAPPKEFDRKIDSIASAPLPVISPGMAGESSGGLKEPSTRYREPGIMESESDMEPDMTPRTKAGPGEVGDTRAPVDFPTDPNSA
jgi:hypothetical protein